ncbi:MAG: trypsin-like peptidase domain-containing protein [Desulfobulbaceae bacterium]|nr:trypsin-like peptidase domain-containing protein [Desulfobulbaceae bacterium]
MHTQKKTLLISLLLLVFCSGHPPCLAENSIKNAVVKIYAVYNTPSYHNPWQMLGQRTFHGSGCIIEGNRILTNAHVVSDQIFIQVRRAGIAKRYTAKLEVVAHECDLAILSVADKDFFSGATPVPIGSLPQIRDKVTVYGFPQGGDKLSITEGIVSRVEHVSYAHSTAYLLACQIDASINSGNSGGPVLKDNKIAGVAFQEMSAANFENIGYMVPAPIIKHFLADIEDGHYDGTPSLGLSMQKLENPDMRRYYRLGEKESGALVNKIYPDSPAEGILQTGDIILEIDGIPIENDGTIEFREGERTYFGLVLQKKFINDTVTLKILRKGQKSTVTIQLTQPLDFDRLVPHMQHDRAPTYFIFGGLVFEPLTLNYLKEFGGDWSLFSPNELMHYYQNGEPDGWREVVVLTEVLADKSNIGYHEFEDNIIVKVNNRDITAVKDLVQAFEEHSGKFHTVEDIRGYKLILSDSAAKESMNRILKNYSISSDRSPDLQRN